MSGVDLSYAFKLPPEKALEYFRNKGYAITFDWQEMLKEAHAKAFTVAKAMNVDILHDIRSAVDRSLAEGLTFQQFQKELEPLLKSKGWWGKQEMLNEATGELRMVQLGSPYRLRTIYQTNLQTSYMTGRYQAMMENTVDRPYWQYIAIMDGRTRPAHRALNGRIFRFDDPVWDIIYPPNGWRCRCRVVALTAADLGDRGLTVENSKGQFTTSERTLPDGSVTRVRGYGGLTPDVGWDYNVGKAGVKTLEEVTSRKLAALQSELPAFLRAKTITEAESIARSMKILHVDYKGLGLDTVNEINRTLAASSIKPGAVFVDVEQFKKWLGKDFEQSPMAANAGNLLINSASYLLDMNDSRTISLKNGNYFADQTIAGFINHELAHIHHRTEFLKNNRVRDWNAWHMASLPSSANIVLIKSEVSEYAAESVGDFVAEVYAGKKAGKRFSSQIIELFTSSLGGGVTWTL